MRMENENQSFLASLFDVHAHHPEKWGASATHQFCASGFSFESNAELIRLAPTFSRGVFSLGLGPQEIQRAEKYPNLEAGISAVEKQVASALASPILRARFVAVGEVGLDNHWGKTPDERERQFSAFERMIALAKKNSLPLVIHSRDAEKECIQQLLAANCTRVLLHCFGGTLAQAQVAAAAGWLISIPPVPTSERKKIIRDIPIASLVLESDAPYIGKTSAHGAWKSAQMVAQYKGLAPDDVVRQTSKNANLFFSTPDA